MVGDAVFISNAYPPIGTGVGHRDDLHPLGVFEGPPTINMMSPLAGADQNRIGQGADSQYMSERVSGSH